MEQCKAASQDVNRVRFLTDDLVERVLELLSTPDT